MKTYAVIFKPLKRGRYGEIFGGCIRALNKKAAELVVIKSGRTANYAGWEVREVAP